MGKLKAMYYLNQFYAGLGGEEKADIGFCTYTEKKGPAIGIEKYWNSEMEVVSIISCGDNFINDDDKFNSILSDIHKIIDRVKPDVFLAGPAFNAGRYGVACAKICYYVQKELGIPAVTSMYYENPAVDMYVKDIYIVESPETAAGMKKVLPILAKLALKLAKKEKVGPARSEGYMPTGHRYNEFHELTGAQRVVDLLIKKINGDRYVTEVPLRTLEKVTPADPILSLSESIVAMVTTGGMVPRGNPDKLKQAFSVSYGKYDINGMDKMPVGDYESIHGGYDTTIVNDDPNRLVPLDEMRILEKEGKFKAIYKHFFSTCGVGTNVENSKSIGRGIVEDLRNGQVDAAILTST
jgi:glycine reductase